LQEVSVEVEAITLVHCKLLPGEEQHELFQNLTLKPVYWKECRVRKKVPFSTYNLASDNYSTDNTSNDDTSNDNTSNDNTSNANMFNDAFLQ
jgi:hypothetical protein